jgi:hypothetical protein
MCYEKKKKEMELTKPERIALFTSPKPEHSSEVLEMHIPITLCRHVPRYKTIPMSSMLDNTRES